MAYIGIGYCGSNATFKLSDFVERHSAWLSGDRIPRLFGENFVVLYDSNTAREFAKKCKRAAPENSIVIYPMSRPVET